MSLDWYSDVCDFMRKFGQEVKETPGYPDYSTLSLRRELIREEFLELFDKGFNKKDMVEVADGVCDLIVVLLGTLAAYGIDPRPIWDEIHRTNMLKEGGGVRGDGKILKPEGWKSPDIKKILIDQGAEEDELV